MAAPASRPSRFDAPTRALAIWLVVAGAIGLVASTTLLVERILLAEDPEYVASCSLNPVLSCGSVMESAQASVLGFPNPIIGVAAFPVLLATGMALLAGARLARWYWLGLQIGATVGLAFVGWLVFQSLYRIHALCPYCMVVWAVVIPVFWYVTLHNLRTGVLGARARRARITGILDVWHAPLLLAVYLGILGLILVEFWDYWSTL